MAAKSFIFRYACNSGDCDGRLIEFRVMSDERVERNVVCEPGTPMCTLHGHPCPMTIVSITDA